VQFCEASPPPFYDGVRSDRLGRRGKICWPSHACEPETAAAAYLAVRMARIVVCNTYWAANG
jgi:hypothetical protein